LVLIRSLPVWFSLGWSGLTGCLTGPAWSNHCQPYCSCEGHFAHSGSFQASRCSSKCPLAESRYSMRLGARVRAILLRQAHSTRPDAHVSSMPLSKGLSRRLDLCLSASPLGQALLRCLVAQVVVFLPGQSPQPSWCSYRCTTAGSCSL
jgi:hypothetical protein